MGNTRNMSNLSTFAVVVAILVGIIVIGARFIERKLLYALSPALVTPEAAGLDGVRLRRLAATDGAEIVTWYAPARPGQPTLLYFHGNAGDLSMRAERMANYLARGQGMMMMAYRGYNGSSGRPSERANVADARLAFDTLVGDGVAASDIILYGESLGSGVAVQVAAERAPGGLVLDAPYSSIVDVAELHYPYLPARLLMVDRYDSVRHIQRVKAPLLIVHGGQDDVVPIELGRRLLQAAQGDKAMVEFPAAGHSDHFAHGSFDAIQKWIAERRAPVTGRIKRVATGD